MGYSSFKQSGLEGFKTKKIKKILGNPPGKPFGITATDVGTNRAYNNGAANISFTKGVGEEPTYYLITSSPGNIAVTTTSTSFVFTGLLSNTSYTFTVTAVNDAGLSDVSDPSSSVLITTVPETPTLSSVDYGYRYLRSNFSGINTGGKSIINYTMDIGSTSSTSVSAGSITISNINASSYSVIVYATNANGNSANSNTLVQSPFDATGGTITTYGSYRVHTFTGTGDFILSGNSLSCDYLVIAGGGGGGGGPGESGGGGGGAGGFLTGSLSGIAAGTHTMTVGAGGGGGNTSTALGGNGNNSSIFNGLTANGGGAGNRVNSVGNNGGSGGAGNGLGLAGQGNNAGPTRGGSQGGSGGGGAGGAGSTGSAGVGLNNSLRTNSPITYAGGGAGGNGYASPAGGGIGASGVTSGGATAGGSASANTGGGGGGATDDVEGSGIGGNGGSGIIVIRYAI